MSKSPQKAKFEARLIPLEVLKPEAALALTPEEKDALEDFERVVQESGKKMGDAFQELAEAFYQIREQQLYRGTHTTFAAYFQEKWGYQRSYANEIADDGEIMKRLSAAADILPSMTTAAHFRPIVHEEEEEQDKIIDQVKHWLEWKSQKTVTPALIKSAKAFVKPAGTPNPPDEKTQKLVTSFSKLVAEAKAELPSDTTDDIRKIFDRLKTKTTALGKASSTTGISWTQRTWNPLQGCTRVSAGCDRCYAAKQIATRMAGLFPGLSKVKPDADGRKQYLFTGKIVLLPEQLGDPLLDLTPRHYFVNSMSDLFHKGVRTDFIESVFQVMEKAHWHIFQILTKRPERQAKFSQEYFKDREPPANIWLGTSTENQEAFDERIPYLRETKAAVRWLSCEPLLGPIEFGSPKNIDWVVVGGESDSIRPMNKEWATSLRNQCKKAKIPYFFKQWGSFDEGGKGPQREKHGLKGPTPTLDGKIHDAYPEGVR